MIHCKRIVTAIALSLGVAPVALAERLPVSASEVPEAVARAVNAKYPSAQGARFVREDARNTTVYAVNLLISGARTDLCIARSGEIEREQRALASSSLPAAVQSSLVASGFGPAQIVAAQRVTRFGSGAALTYEVVVTVQGEKHEVAFDAAGQLVTTPSSSSCVSGPGPTSDRIV